MRRESLPVAALAAFHGSCVSCLCAFLQIVADSRLSVAPLGSRHAVTATANSMPRVLYFIGKPVDMFAAYRAGNPHTNITTETIRSFLEEWTQHFTYWTAQSRPVMIVSHETLFGPLGRSTARRLLEFLAVPEGDFFDWWYFCAMKDVQHRASPSTEADLGIDVLLQEQARNLQVPFTHHYTIG